MKSSQRWWTVIPIYAFFGIALGLFDADLGRAANIVGFPRGMATALSVNVLLPLVMLGLAFTRPAFQSACLGAIAMTIGFIAGLAVIYPPAGPWSLVAVLTNVRPMIVVAGLGYVLLGSLAVCVRRHFQMQ